MRATNLEAMYKAAGLNVEIEGGRVGLVVYGPNRKTVTEACLNLAKAPRAVGVEVKISEIEEEKDEPAATRYTAIVGFDWEAFPVSLE